MVITRINPNFDTFPTASGDSRRGEWLDGIMDDDQQFCLRWNNHQSTLVSVFDTLLEKGMHVDCTLAAEGQTLKAHKVVLSACSPYFESVLSQQYDKHPIIILKDVKYAELRAMMDYMYRGEVNISQDQLAALLKAAESLQIKGLSDNKPSRPPSRPAQAVPAHPPRAPSPPPQVRDGSIDSREGSVSPTRRRKKARRMSSEIPPVPIPPPNDNAQGNGEDTAPCKEELQRDGVEDLTLDEETDDQPAVAHNDVVRNFQWHMERSQDDLMNSSDSARESQGKPPAVATRRVLRQHVALALLSISIFYYVMLLKRYSSASGNEPLILHYAKTPFPLTRGYFKNIKVKSEDGCKQSNKKKVRKISRKKMVAAVQKRSSQNSTLRHSIVTRSKKVDETTTLAILKTVKSPPPPPVSTTEETKENKKLENKSLKPATPKPSPKVSPKASPDSSPERGERGGKASPYNILPPASARLECAQYKTDKGYRCPKCQRCYNARKNLVRHVTLECGREPQYKCPYCPYSKHRRNELKKHIDKKHPNQPSLELHKDSHLPSALLSLLSVQQAQSQSLVSLVPSCIQVTNIMKPSATKDLAPYPSPLHIPKLPLDTLNSIPENIKAHLLQQAFMQNNNTVTPNIDYKLPIKQDDTESDAEYDDTDDIVLPEESDTFYDSNGGFPGNSGGIHSDDGFETKPDMKGHWKRDGNSSDDASRQFECKHCGKKYRWKSTLRRHENVECGGKAPSHQCPYCSYKAKQRGNLGVHIRKHHNNEWYIYASNKFISLHVCNLLLGGGCSGPEDVSFTRIGGLTWDQWSARLALPFAGMRVPAPSLPPTVGEPSFTCADCGRVYKLKSSLRNHQKWECGKEPQFQCPYCVYRAKQKMHIARHMERMHREVHIKPEQYIKQDNVDACT
ncbi:hypothetical protein HW555_013189 [Spodoptera exigua]|uniref:Longitudinals lacking protein n=1 Tax=Spodoptera exigua TaxID=7107 RepID=A0A835G3E6_SPOEX|nr:hypothetical protein HW555_013189 [Spodoptera exigua]